MPGFPKFIKNMFGSSRSFNSDFDFDFDECEARRLNDNSIEKSQRERAQLRATLDKEMMLNMNDNTAHYVPHIGIEGEDDDEAEDAKLLAQAAIDAANKLLQQEVYFERTVEGQHQKPQQQKHTPHSASFNVPGHPLNLSSSTTNENRFCFNLNANSHRRVIDTKFYDLLSVHSNATSKEIKAAYHKMALIYHPDKQAQYSKASGNNDAKMKLLGDIYKVLSNPNLRLLYDMYGEQFVRKCKHKL